MRPEPWRAVVVEPARKRRSRVPAVYALLVVLVAFLGASRAEEQPLVLLIQPLPSEERAVATYRPLAGYLETLAGRPWVIEMPPNFPAYWEAVRRGQYELAFDAPHFTDYRRLKLGFIVLAKTPDSASYSLVVRSAEGIVDPGQLVGKRVASLGLLSIGTLRLNVLFPNALRQPILVDAGTAEEALGSLRRRRVEAAFLPTTAVRRHIAAGGIAVLLTTEPVPPLGISASPRLPAALRKKIRDGLLQAHRLEAGQSMLRAIALERFHPAGAEDFANQSYVLRGYWGY